MAERSLEDRLLEFVTSAHYSPLKPRQIAKRLNLSEDDESELKRLVKRLVKSGRLAWGQKHLLLRGPAAAFAAEQAGPAPAAVVDEEEFADEDAEAIEPLPEPARKKRSSPKSDKPADAPPVHVPTGGTSSAALLNMSAGSRMAGIFRRTARGHGYVRPLGAPAGNDRDVYVPANEARDASTGDTVLVEIKRSRGPKGQHVGFVNEVLERETHQFVGTYFETGGQAYADVDGRIFAQPIAVGDPGAKAAKPDDKVVIEMVRFPTHVHDGEGVIVRVLGQRGAPGIDTLTIIHEFNLPGDFAEDAQEQSREEADKFTAEVGDRLDLTAETIITIDPVDARDFDDAISLTRLENGHWRLGVHIADVSYFVRPKTPLDREARDRATSVYLPDRVIPMIPEIISNGLASLQPDKVRYVKTCFIEFTPDGARVGAELHEAAIQSKRRFSYEEVDAYLADREAWRSKLAGQVHDLLARMHELAMILRQRRLRRGAIELTMQEVKIDLDRDGRVSGAHRVEHTESHQIIEEFMLAANEAVAETLRARGWFFLRRIHAPPEPRKTRSLTEFVKDLGFKTGSLENRFEVQKLLDSVKGHPAEPAVNFAVLRSMKQAVYGPDDAGHYALAADCYCHFTSPIRRYPDLTVHRLVETLITGKKPRQDIETYIKLGEHCSERERRAEAAERELTKIKLLHYLEDKVGMQLDAVIVGVESFGLFVQGVKLPAEGLVHISTLTDDYYHFERTSHSLSGHRQGNQYRLGDQVTVEVAHVDPDTRELDFRLVSRGWTAGDAETSAPTKGKRGDRVPAGEAGSAGRETKSGGSSSTNFRRTADKRKGKSAGRGRSDARHKKRGR